MFAITEYTHGHIPVFPSQQPGATRVLYILLMSLTYRFLYKLPR